MYTGEFFHADGPSPVLIQIVTSQPQIASIHSDMMLQTNDSVLKQAFILFEDLKF
jgi:hypothetical protein